MKSPVYLSLNKPNLTCGIDTYAWLFACVMFAVGWAFTKSLVGGLGAFSLVWLAARAATKNDPRAALVYVYAARLKPIYDGSIKEKCLR